MSKNLVFSPLFFLTQQVEKGGFSPLEAEACLPIIHL
jgi:hypothetical protein